MRKYQLSILRHDILSPDVAEVGYVLVEPHYLAAVLVLDVLALGAGGQDSGRLWGVRQEGRGGGDAGSRLDEIGGRVSNEHEVYGVD